MRTTSINYRQEQGEACTVLIARYYYGPTEMTRALYDDDGSGAVREFDSFAEARTWIDEQEAEQYLLAHNESARATYTLIII